MRTLDSKNLSRRAKDTNGFHWNLKRRHRTGTN